MTRIGTEAIFAVDREPIKHMRPPRSELCGAFCGRQNTLSKSDKTTHQEVPSAGPSVLPHGAAA
jgi:hypothetical protein